MRTFIVLCFIALASAGNLGYNYQPANSINEGISLPAGGGGLFGLNGATTNNVPSVASPSSGQSTYSAPSGELEKEYFTFTANDDDFNDPAASEQVANSLKQNLRVVFIKGPENNGLENAVLGLASQASDQKTAIYVLNKQADISGLANKLNNLRNDNNHKPEVHFVKYRTPEDAANAQQHIQSHYDALGGPSQSHNGGVAPVLNFASQAPAGSNGGYGSPSAPVGNYLPASIFRRY